MFEYRVLENMHEAHLEMLVAFRCDGVVIRVWESPDTRGFNIPEFQVKGRTVLEAVEQLKGHFENTAIGKQLQRSYQAAQPEPEGR